MESEEVAARSVGEGRLRFLLVGAAFFVGEGERDDEADAWP